MGCEDDAKTSLPGHTPTEAQIRAAQSKMDSCVIRCGKHAQETVPVMKKRIGEALEEVRQKTM